MFKKYISVLLFQLSLLSCSPLYTLHVQNNTEKSIDIFVELKDNKHNKNTRKTFEKRVTYKYVLPKNDNNQDFDSLTFYAQKSIKVEKSYNFTSDLKYNFTLESNTITNIDPNNGISIYPFERVYFVNNGVKCFIVPLEKNNSCSLKLSHIEKLKKNKNIKSTSDVIEIVN